MPALAGCQILHRLGERKPGNMRQRQRALAAYNLGCLMANTGRRAQALEWLRKAVDYGAMDMRNGSPSMAQDPDLESLHGDPAFEEIVEEIRR